MSFFCHCSKHGAPMERRSKGNTFLVLRHAAFVSGKPKLIVLDFRTLAPVAFFKCFSAALVSDLVFEATQSDGTMISKSRKCASCAVKRMQTSAARPVRITVFVPRWRSRVSSVVSKKADDLGL